jgi:hypothetical protein
VDVGVELVGVGEAGVVPLLEGLGELVLVVGLGELVVGVGVDVACGCTWRITW